MPDPLRDDVGAYGLRIRGLERARELLVPADPGWPTLTIEQTSLDGLGPGPPSADRATLRFTDGGAEIGLAGGTRVLLDRTARRATFAAAKPLREHELVHPYLGAVGAVFARWLGRECFHAGAFAVDGGVWALVADRGGGKSSLLAWLAEQGHPIVCDDILVVDGGRTFAGPRSIDLREEPARRLGAGEPLGVVGVRERWRLRIADAPSGLPLRGWVLLAWGPQLEVSRLDVGERLKRVAAQVAIAIAPTQPSVLLDLAGLPALELRRPWGWDAFEAAAERLLDVVS